MLSKIELKNIKNVGSDVVIVEFLKNEELYKVVLRNDKISCVFKNGKEYEVMIKECENLEKIIDRLCEEKKFLHDDGVFQGLEIAYKELANRFEIPMEKINILDYSSSLENDILSVNGEAYVRYNDYTRLEYKFYIAFGKMYNEVYDIRIDEI